MTAGTAPARRISAAAAAAAAVAAAAAAAAAAAEASSRPCGLQCVRVCKRVIYAASGHLCL